MTDKQSILSLVDEVVVCDESRRDGGPLVWKLDMSAENVALIFARAVRDAATVARVLSEDKECQCKCCFESRMHLGALLIRLKR